MIEIGRVALAQIQRSSLKVGQKPFRYYDPAPLLAVPRLRLTPSGAVGISGDDELLDVHNRQHAATRNQGPNSLSFGFTSHYAAMRDRFGQHLADGVAGENILIASERAFALADLGAALLIRGDDGREARLTDLIVAAPCVEFSQFACLADGPLTPEQLRAALQFLNDGVRGFYARLADGPGAEVRPGDRVFVVA
ncbi:MAG TPA: hypothetical protein PLO33_03845 [Kouleothrix sp.]|uniref:hypothetical protein n=1 Tax=Kouleothrix sp. TaxID=2779161 RepID=UPI002BE64B96|nr:hypothetical protein [Kouleothrix sp.]HRC74784.1 hypothetical protein [Kouleothrix sp.]